MLIVNFGVSTVIFNPVDIFHRWCKLNFGLMQSQVKSHRFSERIGVRRQYFNFLHKLRRIISWKRLGQPFSKLIWIYCNLLNGTGLDLTCITRS